VLKEQVVDLSGAKNSIFRKKEVMSWAVLLKNAEKK
jgi:hypothetical protein